MKRFLRDFLALVLAVSLAFTPALSVLAAETESEAVTAVSEDSAQPAEAEETEVAIAESEDSEAHAESEDGEEPAEAEETEAAIAESEETEEPADTEKTDEIPAEQQEASEPANAEPNASGTIASGSCGENAKFTLDSNGVLKITGSGTVDDNSGWADYLDQVKKLEVSGPSVLDDWLFRGHTNLKSIVLGDSVTEIGAHCFAQSAYESNTVLESVQFGRGIQEIGVGAFYGAKGIQTVTITDLAVWCSVDIDYSKDKYEVDSVSSPLEYGAKLMLNGKLVTELTVPDTVTRIGSHAFFKYQYLETLVIPASVTRMGADAFGDTPNLSSVTFLGHAPEPEWHYFSEFSYASGTFCGDTGQVEIHQPLDDTTYTNRVRLLYSSTYMCHDDPDEDPNEDWPDLRILKSDVSYVCRRVRWAEWNSNWIGHGGCGENLTWVLDKKGLLTISGSGEMDVYSYAYTWWNNSSSVSRVVIEEGATSICDSAFSGCYMNDIWIPKSVTSIGSSALGYNYAMTVYYQGSKEEWEAIDIDEYNYNLQDAKIIYNSESSEDMTRFTLGRDNNGFMTDPSEGFRGIENYPLADGFYEKLVKNSGFIEKNKIKKQMKESFGGACHGLSMTMGLVYEGCISISDLTNSGADCYHSLNAPCKDNKLLNMIMYYHLSQFLKKGPEKTAVVSRTYDSFWFMLKNCFMNYDSESDFLQNLVNYFENNQIALLGLSAGNSDHTVLVTSCKYDTDKDYYLLEIYDQNCICFEGDKGTYGYMVIKKDFSGFSLIDPYGITVDSDSSYRYMYFLDFKKVDTSITKRSSDSSNHTRIEFPLGEQFKITDETGKYLLYDGESLSGDLEVYDIDTVSFGEGGRLIIEVSETSRLTVTDMGSSIDLDVSNDETLMSVSGSSVTEATIDLNEGVKLSGNDFDFKVFVSTDEIAEDENGLISLSGTVKSELEVTVDGTGAAVEADEILSNIETASYIGTDVIEREYTDVEASFSVDDDARIDNGTEIFVSVESVSIESGAAEMLTSRSEEEKSTLQLTAKIKPLNATNTNVIWRSSDPEVATVDENGLATALTYGRTTITATTEDGGLSADFEIQTRYYDVAGSPNKEDDDYQYYYTPVYWAADRNITKGYGNVYFGPDENCKREQMITFLYRAAGSPQVSGTVKFSDVKKGAYYYNAVLWAYQNGITKGYTSGPNKGKFGVGLNVTREDTVTFIYRMAGKPDYSTTKSFKDGVKGKYYYDAVLWAAQKKITNGYSDGTFGVGKDVLRRDIVTFLYRYDTQK